MEWHGWFWLGIDGFLRKGSCYGMAQMVLVRHRKGNCYGIAQMVSFVIIAIVES